jgi:hypothetical protein
VGLMFSKPQTVPPRSSPILIRGHRRSNSREAYKQVCRQDWRSRLPVAVSLILRVADHPLGVRRSLRWIARLSAKCSRIDVSKGSLRNTAKLFSCDTEVCSSSNALCECVMNPVVAVGRRRFGRSRVARRVGAGVQTS